MKEDDVVAVEHTDRIQQASPHSGNGFPLRVYFGHHKCASGWIDNILREICLHMGLKFKIVHQPYSFEQYGTLAPLVREQNIRS